MKRFFFSAALALACTLVAAQAPALNPTQRLRGTVESFDGSTLVVKERSGEVLRLALADNFSVSEVVPIELSAIQDNSYIGAAAMPQPDGTLRALEVRVFPEAARGKTLSVPEGVPFVTFKPGDRSLLVAGAKVLVTAQLRDGKPTALRALAGRGGFAPPM